MKKIELKIADEGGYFPSQLECCMRLRERQSVGISIGTNTFEKEILDIPELFSNKKSRESVYNNTVAKILDL